MSYQARGVDITLPAGADLSASQFRAVKMSGNTVVLATAGDFAVGILQNKPASGQPATVRISGISKASADAAVAAGATVASSADGQVVAAVRATDNILGVALEAAGGANVIIPVLLTLSGVGVAD